MGKPLKALVAIGVVVVVAAVAGAIYWVVGDPDSGGPTAIEKAAVECDARSPEEDGRSFEVVLRSTDPDSYLDLTCVLGELNAPEDIYDRIANYSALEPPQSQEWDEFEATWSEGDGGLLVVVEEG